MNFRFKQLRADLLEIRDRYGDAMGSDRDIRRLAAILSEALRVIEEEVEDAKRGRPQGA